MRVKKTEVKDPSPTHQVDSLLQKFKTLLLMVYKVTSMSLNTTSPGSRICPQAGRGSVMSTLLGTTTLVSKSMHSHCTEETPMW